MLLFLDENNMNMISYLNLFQSVFEHLGDLLAVLITLEKILDNSVIFKEHWKQYKR